MCVSKGWRLPVMLCICVCERENVSDREDTGRENRREREREREREKERERDKERERGRENFCVHLVPSFVCAIATAVLTDHTISVRKRASHTSHPVLPVQILYRTILYSD